MNKYGVIDKHKTFRGFTNVSDNLDRKEYFKMADGDELVAKVPLSWKKSFSMGVVISHKMRNCNKCTKDLLCDDCDKLVNQNTEFSANLNELKREAPNDFGHMLPKYIITSKRHFSIKYMEIKLVCDCLNFIVSMIFFSIEKKVGIGNLEVIRDYMIGMYKDKYIEDMVSMLAVLSQINLIIDRFYLDNESDIRKQYCTLRKSILAWLRESNTEPEVDNDG